MRADELAVVVTVSIPSRRVGDLNLMLNKQRQSYGFHPLKAGRRPVLSEIPAHCSPTGFHPLKAGRRPWDAFKEVLRQFSFHPLKAGRRQSPPRVTPKAIKVVSIPSRRVGDRLYWIPWFGQKLVSIPSRRVGDPIGL